MLNRRMCAAALMATAAIHVAVAPEHQREWPAAAAFFVLLATIELALAAIVLTNTSRRLLVVGAAVSIASGLVWAASRTVGLPIGPQVFTAEPAAAPDVVSTLLEATAAVLFVRIATRAPTAAPAHRPA